MHICFVEYGYPHIHGGGGGAGTYVQLFARELAKRGFEVSVVTSRCSQCPANYLDGAIKIYRSFSLGNVHYYLSKFPLIKKTSSAVRYLETGIPIFRSLENIQRASSIDLIEFTEGGDFWHSFIHDFRYVTHLHGSAFTFQFHAMNGVVSKEQYYQRGLELRFIQKAKGIFSPSQCMLESVQKEAKRPLCNSHVIPYPLDPRLLAKQRAFPQSNKKKVLFAARNDPVKGAKILLEAIPIVNQKVPNVQFDFYGYNPLPDRILPHNVKIHPFIPKEQLIEQYQETDLCVVPSLWDNSPNTIYEAMAAGKPVVASRTGGIPELVVDHETGLLVQPGNVQELSEAITYLLMNSLECKRMGENGNDHIRKIADLEENVTRRLSIFSSIINT